MCQPHVQTEANNLDRNAVATGVASFLEGALNSKSANKHLRRANMLVMGKQVCRCILRLEMVADSDEECSEKVFRQQ